MKLSGINRFLLLIILFYLQFLSSCQKESTANRESDTPLVDTTTSHQQNAALYATFQKTYDGSLYDLGGSVLQTDDGGYAIAGSSDGDFYLIKTDQNGKILWSKTYGGAPFEEAYFVQQTSDHGYILSGEDETNDYLIVAKTDSSGNLLWSKQYTADFVTWGSSCLQATDGGFVFTGHANYDVVLFKLDLNGNLLWSHSFDAGDFEEGLSLQKTSDGGYCIAGYIGTCDAYLVKTDADGNLLWSKSYNLGITDDAFSVQQCSDGGFILSGETGDLANNSFDIYLLKTDPDGNVLWSKLYDNPDWNFPQTVLQSNDQGYLVIGTENYAGSNSNIWVIKTDIDGSIIWSKTYGGAGGEIAWRSAAGEQTTDGGYIIGGYSKSFGANIDIYVIKTDINGHSGCNEKDLMPVVTTPTVHVANPNTIVTVTPGTLTNYSMTTERGGIDSTLCYTLH